LNKDRKEMTEKSVEAVINKINNENLYSDKVFVIYDENIHESIAGIVAGRVKEKYNTPTIVLTKGHEMAKGSARSIEKYNMFEELTRCRHLLGRFGGHPMAAGLSITEDNIQKLRITLNENSTLTEADKIPKLLIDMHLPLESLSFEILDDIKKLEPFGKGNAKPVFAEKKIQILKARVLGKNMNMLKLTLKSFKGTVIDALQFEGVSGFEEFIQNNYPSEFIRYTHGLSLNNVRIDLVYSTAVNEYAGNRTLQLQIIDYRKSN
jgi:single-stranded-DNA-specific exonuclease